MRKRVSDVPAEIRELKKPNRVWSYFRLEKWPLIAVTVSGILYNAGMTAGPWFEGKLAQRLYDVIGGSKTFRDMLTLAVYYVAVILFVQSMRYIKRFYVRRFANNVNRNMKHVLYNNLVHKSKPDFEKESVGNMMTRAISDVDTCVEGMRKFTTEVFDTGVVMLAYTVMLFSYDWRLALLSCIFPPFAYLTAEKLKKVVTHSAAAYKESAGKLSSATLERVSGTLTYRVFSQEPERNTAYEKLLADYEKRAVKANIWETTMQPLYQIISMTSVLFVIWFGAKNVQGTGWTAWDIAAFTTFLSCFAKLAVKSSKAAKLFNAVQKAQVSWTRIKPLLEETGEEAEAVAAEPAQLSVSDLSFAYPDGKEIYSGLSFDAEPGEVIGVTGPVAGGKSTLGRTFLCEYPYGGSIRYGGRELSKLTDAERSGIIGYMGHQPELISGSIEENILLGCSEDAKIYLDAVCMGQELAEMPEGIHTRIGSGGARLSGGQQARVAIARTLCSRRPVMILDDPFSAVDRATERKIMENLSRLTKNSIVIIISHRLYMFPEFDQVFWVENGTVKVSRHDKLMRDQSEYAQLYRTQTEGGGHYEA